MRYAPIILSQYLILYKALELFKCFKKGYMQSDEKHFTF